MIKVTREREQLRVKLKDLIRRRGNYEMKIDLIDQEIDEVKAKLDATKVRRGTLEAAE